MPSLRNIRVFIEVAAATGSLNLAAENLNITALGGQPSIAVAWSNFLGKTVLPQQQRRHVNGGGRKYLKEVSGALEYDWSATSQVINDIHQDYLRIHSCRASACYG